MLFLAHRLNYRFVLLNIILIVHIIYKTLFESYNFSERTKMFVIMFKDK